jgi:triosephosphate isomerase
MDEMTGGRRPVVGISLKMYFDPQRSVDWAARVAAIARAHAATRGGQVRLFVLPSLPALASVRAAIGDAPIEVGAQDLFWEDRGPYTGGVSGADLVAVGCTLVEVGHAERRRYFSDTDLIVGLKLAAAFRNGLTPVLCLGERTPKSAESAAEECITQLESSIFGLPQPTTPLPLIVAYEPEWAIGVERSADPEHVNHVTGLLRRFLDDRPWLAGSSIIYGGSAQPGLLPQLDGSIDGLFLGRFAHDPEALSRTLDETLAVR